MRLGARIFKTGIVIVLAIYLSQWLGMPSPVLAGIAAIFAIQPNIYRSYLTVVDQIQANIIGAFIAILFVFVFGNHIIIVGLAAISTIVVLLKVKLESSITIALVTIIAIMMEVRDEQFLQFSLIRMLNVSIGVLSSFLVNLVFLPPKYETKLFSSINQLNEEVLKWIRISSRNASESHLLKKDIMRHREKMVKIDNMFILYKEDRTPFKKDLRAKQRKIVLYRKLIAVTSKSMGILQRLNQYENELHHLDGYLLRMIQEQLDCLVSYQEHLMLRFVGKAKTTETSEVLFGACMDRPEFLQIFMNEIHKDNKDELVSSIHMLYIVTAILEYSEALEHFDHLITSFYKYHPDDEAPEYEEEI